MQMDDIVSDSSHHEIPSERASNGAMLAVVAYE
jgi:hypothetical protein